MSSLNLIDIARLINKRFDKLEEELRLIKEELEKLKVLGNI